MNERFDAVLRRHLRLLPAGQELCAEMVLAELGLDSLAAVSLILDLEDELEVTLPDSSFAAGTFRTVDTLWTAMRDQLDKQTTG